MKTITVQELKSELASQRGLTLLDVRTPDEYREVHIREACNEPLGVLEKRSPELLRELKPDSPVYVICQTGVRTAKAVQFLEGAGFRRVIAVDGGTSAWVDAGLPVERSGHKAISLERQVRIAAGSLVVTGILLSQLVHPGFIGISAFVGCGLVFAGITDWCGMGILLAKAPWNTRTRTA